MSAIAAFLRLPANDLELLRTDYDVVLDEADIAAEYEWSGYVMGALLPYLQEQGIDLMHSPYDALSEEVSSEQDQTVFVFTPDHKKQYLVRLAPERFSTDALRDYYRGFMESDDTDAGEAMLAGIAAIRESLSDLDEDSVVVLVIA